VLTVPCSSACRGSGASTATPRGTSTSDDLITHELCHVWQLQHQPLAMPLSYLRQGYALNPYEAEAERAVVATRGDAQNGCH
jgi:hypothetical protein